MPLRLAGGMPVDTFAIEMVYSNIPIPHFRKCWKQLVACGSIRSTFHNASFDNLDLFAPLSVLYHLLACSTLLALFFPRRRRRLRHGLPCASELL